MLSNALGESARAHDGQQPMELLPWSERGRDNDKVSASTSTSAAGPKTKNRDKIKSLDGLRGIACLLVFNYHFLWPWTPHIMLGHGALPPGATEPYTGWPFMPIICLLHRGRAMVAIFFAISGYVLCRHILRAIHERRIEAAYHSLASSVFRRVFRLYIPPTISMFLVAMLAQMGAFRSEESIFKGPDSVYINGTVTKIANLGLPCKNGTVALNGASGVAEYMGLPDPMFLGNTTGWTDKKLCLNVTSQLTSPAILYTLVDHSPSSSSNDSSVIEEMKREEERRAKYRIADSAHLKQSSNSTNTTNLDLMWIRFGGSWEEHPHIHDNVTYALRNFTRVYAEWANPFNFGHYHPRYDPHTFTIPIELRGSMFIYIFLLGTAALKARWRHRLAGILSAYSLFIGRWDMATFLGGALLSELDIGRSDRHGRTLAPTNAGSARSHRPGGASSSISRDAVMGWFGIVVALYFLSYPDVGAEYTPGFVFLSYLVPKYYYPLSGWMFYQSMGALILLPCVLRSPLLCTILEGRVAQYLGRISFSLYLVHGPVLHSLGFWIMPRLFDNFGRMGGFMIGWVVLLSITLYLANLWYKKVDLWSTTVGKRVEKHLSE